MGARSLEWGMEVAVIGRRALGRALFISGCLKCRTCRLRPDVCHSNRLGVGEFTRAGLAFV